VCARGERVAVEGFVLEPGEVEVLRLDLP